MKRFLLILLALMLLSGCAVDEPPVQTTQPPAPTEPPSSYIANSAVEQQSGGAVRAYMPSGGKYIGLAVLGNDPVVVTDLSALIMVDAQTGKTKASLKAGESIRTDDITFGHTDQGISYYRSSEREVVVVNASLRQVAKGQLPAELETLPVVSIGAQEAYYCWGKEIRALDLQTGISRIVKSQVCQSLELLNGYFDARVLELQITDDQERISRVYISSENGQTLREDVQIQNLQTWDDQYMAVVKDGIVEQQLFGKKEEAPRNLDTQEQVKALLKMNGAVRYTVDENYLTLYYYDLTTGKQSATVKLLGLSEPVAISCGSDAVWFIASENGNSLLYRWDIAMTPSQDDTQYVFPMFTRENQDTAGLEACKARAQQIFETYGVEILVGEAVKEMTGGYEITDEYQVWAINHTMDILEKTIKTFPQDFFKNSLKSGTVRVGILREIAGDKSMVHFYNAGNAYILLTVDGNVKQNFIHGFGYVMDSKVLGNSRDFDTWDKLNPKGFAYDYNYYQYNEKAEKSEYLTGDTRAFVDAWSMTYPHEDRCRIFVAAMTPDNQEVFASTTMQKKLQRVCDGIREAWDLEKVPTAYPWELYLQ